MESNSQEAEEGKGEAEVCASMFARLSAVLCSLSIDDGMWHVQ